MTRKMKLLALAVTLALLTAACGGADEASQGTASEGQSEAAAADGGGEALSVWIMQPGSEDIETIVNDTAAAFEEASGASVDVQFVPWANAHDQFVTAIGGGQVPDVAEMGTTWTGEFAELGALAPVEVDTGGDYVESLVSSATVDDTTYGYPWYAGARSLIYRTDVFEELGLEPPTTWEELLTAGDAIAEEGDIDPIHVAGDNLHVEAPLIWQAGGDIATPGETWTATVDSEAGHEAFAFYKELWDKGWSPNGAVNWNSVDLRDAFANGDSAMLIGGGWDLAAILSTNPELEGKVGTALAPAGPGGNQDAFAGGSHLVTFAESENAELGAQFIEFMLEPEQVTAFTEAVGFLPGTVSGVEASSASGDELYGTFAEQLVEHSRSYPATAAWGQIEGEKVFENATQQLLQGELTPEEAAAQVNQQIQEAFDG